MKNTTIPLTIYIRTHNEESRIGAVVRRAISTGAEVIIVDDESTDKTKMIAKEAGAIVFENKWEEVESKKDLLKI